MPRQGFKIDTRPLYRVTYTISPANRERHQFDVRAWDADAAVSAVVVMLQRHYPAMCPLTAERVEPAR